MLRSEPTRTAHRPRRLAPPVLLAVCAVLIGILIGHGRPSASPSVTPGSSSTSHSSVAAATTTTTSTPTNAPRGDRQGPLGEADGVVPDGVTVFDDDVPAVTKLDPDLLQALRTAATDAADDRVTFYVNSGWRSPAYQTQLLRQAISKYGSEAEAAKWVATAETSPHVSGEAIDIGGSPATRWLSEHGADYGLCQIYRNEPWHYELRPEAIDDGCPPRYTDPTHDPRMH